MQSEVQKELPTLVKNFNKPPLTLANFKQQEDTLKFEYSATNDANCFSISVIIYPNECLIACDGWHDTLTLCLTQSPVETAQIIFEQLLTLLNGQTILSTTFAGDTPYKWELIYEYKKGKTESLGITHLAFYNYFAKRKRIMRKNEVLRDHMLNSLSKK